MRAIGGNRPERLLTGRLFAALVAAVCVLAIGGGSHAQDGPAGITEPTVFQPFKSDAPPCTPPPALQKVLAFAQDNERDFMMGVRYGLSAAAHDRAMGFRVSVGKNDPAKMIEQVEGYVAEKVGAVVAAPVDPLSLSRSLQKVIWSGGYVGTVVPPPATSLLNAPQYLTGRVLGDTAAKYIRTNLGGRAKVVLLTHDGLQYLAPRFVAMRDALRDIPGVAIVADISPATVNKDGGFAVMRTILLAQPNVDVVLGADTVVLGALSALREAGKARENQFLGGIDGEPDAIAEIRRGGPYKASIGLASPVFGYAMGQHAADWLEGRSIPQAIDILPTAIDAGNIARYEADLNDPAAVYADPVRKAAYLKMYGNICYDTRDQYVNFPWSSERK